ncbi:hypothetical protein GCM10009817_07230 [Terrabacter lapilli]|uniref:Uncharacterized protein n=1 Tax=Terrabacter lapilli TaxID=436231 RepID=A0ABN2RIU5_9MICO
MPRGRNAANLLTRPAFGGRLSGVSLLRGLFGDRAGRRSEPAPAVVVRDVGHRVFVERAPQEVWPHLVAPGAGAELGVDCVRVVPLQPPELVAVWRRPNGRLWAGLSTLVDLEPGVRVVSRSQDGGADLTLTTTLEPLDGGCVVAQQLSGLAPTDPGADFARAWLARALLGLKADVEGIPRGRTRGPASDGPADDAATDSLIGHGGTSGGARAVVPVHQTVSVDVGVPPERLWEVLRQPSSEQLLKPSLQQVVRLDLADEPGREHVVAVHRRDDGRRAVSVSLVVEATAPARTVERDLTSAHEADVVTTIEPGELGARLTETVTGWLPAGDGRVVDASALAGLIRARLSVVKSLAEAPEVAPRRDPRTGFLPPGQPANRVADPGPAPDPAPDPARDRVPDLPPPVPAAVPSSVLLPPPHVAAPAAGYDLGPWPTWGDGGFSTETDLLWW